MKSNSAFSRILILQDIRSAQNVGSLFRTADAAGIEHLYLSGITPTPIDRFGRKEKMIAKTALGAEDIISWESVSDIRALLSELKKQSVQVIAIEQSSDAVDYREIVAHEPVAFVLGNEVSGLPRDILDRADSIAEIPMRGQKESLNVAVAGGVAIFRMLGI